MTDLLAEVRARHNTLHRCTGPDAGPGDEAGWYDGSSLRPCDAAKLAALLTPERLAAAWGEVMDGRRIGEGLHAARINADTTTPDDWAVIIAALAAQGWRITRDARRLTVEIGQHLERVSREVGYTHPEHLSGQEWPATDIPCLPVIVAQQVVEKHLEEAADDPASAQAVPERVSIGGEIWLRAAIEQAAVRAALEGLRAEVEEEDNPDPNAMWRRGVGDEHERIIALIDARLADLP